MWENMRSCYVTDSMKRIEIPLSHIRNKNKFKNVDSLFPLIQCFKTNFCYILYSMFYDYYLFHLAHCFKTFHLSHTQKLFAFPFIIFTFTPLHTHVHSLSYHLISNTLRKKWCHLASTFQWHHNSNFVVSFDCNSYEQAMTKEGGLSFLFNDSSLWFWCWSQTL